MTLLIAFQIQFGKTTTYVSKINTAQRKNQTCYGNIN